MHRFFEPQGAALLPDNQGFFEVEADALLQDDQEEINLAEIFPGARDDVELQRNVYDFLVQQEYPRMATKEQRQLWDLFAYTEHCGDEYLPELISLHELLGHENFAAIVQAHRYIIFNSCAGQQAMECLTWFGSVYPLEELRDILKKSANYILNCAGSQNKIELLQWFTSFVSFEELEGTDLYLAGLWDALAVKQYESLSFYKECLSIKEIARILPHIIWLSYSFMEERSELMQWIIQNFSTEQLSLAVQAISDDFSQMANKGEFFTQASNFDHLWQDRYITRAAIVEHLAQHSPDFSPAVSVVAAEFEALELAEENMRRLCRR